MTKVSVVMSVYNDERFLKEAIDSILSQTFSDFEFIIINDGSTDRSDDIIQGYYDARIVYIKQKNRGLPSALNKGIQISRGEYIARMDGDDVAHPQRLERQYKYMEENADIFLNGTIMKCFGYKKMYVGCFSDIEEAKIWTLFWNPIGHPTWFFRNNSSYRIKYNETFLKSQDYELMTRLVMDKVGLSVLEEPLMFYRERNRSLEVSEDIYTARVMKNFMSSWKIKTSDDTIRNMHKFIKKEYISKEKRKEVENVFLDIINRNKSLGIFNQYYLEKFFFDRGLYG